MKNQWRRLSTYFVGLAVVATVALSGCNDDDDTTTPAPTTNTVTDVVVNGDDYSILETAVVKAGLADSLKTGSLTLFAPNNAAFTASGLDLNAVNAMDAATLKSVLKYHVLTTKTDAASIAAANNTEVTTLNGAKAYVTKNEGGVSINGAKVTTPDLAATNGVVHVIDRVLMPPNGNLLAVAQADTSLTYLVAALNKVINSNPTAGGTISAALSGAAPYTVFAPTNAAFRGAGFASVDAINAVADTSLTRLTNTLLAHVVSGRSFSTNLVTGTLPSAGTAPLTITTGTSGVQVRGAGNGTTNANVTKANVVASNGVVHVIDRVILP
jgi:uncharacterized surface protein with fasciclin (FAS1) repeats